MFESGELALVLLHLIEARSRHGYDLIQEVQSMTGGAYTPSPGIVYPTLTLLEELGEIETPPNEGAKRIYTLTGAGRTRLAGQRDALTAVLGKLTTLDGTHEEPDRMRSGPVWRAMQNLTTVLQQRVAGSSERQFLLDIADAIDDAARKIERM